MAENSADTSFPLGADYILGLFLGWQFLYILPAMCISAVEAEGTWLENLVETASFMIIYLIIAWRLIRMALIQEVDLKKLIGRWPGLKEISRLIPYFFFLPAMSLGLLWAVFLPTSYLFPKFAQWCISDSRNALYQTEGAYDLLSNTLTFLFVTIIAPVVEELVFRGLLLTRLSCRWGTFRAVVVTSLLFGIMHGSSMVSGALFGFILSVTYIKTRSLFIPIAIHMGNNLVGWALDLAGTCFGAAESYSILNFREDWWIGAVGLLIGLPWMVMFVKKNFFYVKRMTPYYNPS